MKAPSAFAWAPLRWALAGFAAGAIFVVLGYADADLVNRRFEHAQHLVGVIDDDHDGESLTIPITYDNPLTEQRVHTTFRVLHYDEVPEPGSIVAIEVGRDDPRAVRFEGASLDPGEDRVEIGAVIALLLSGPLLARWFGLWRTKQLIARPDKSFVMSAALTARRRGRRPLLHLYPLDSGPSSPAICVVPLAASLGLPIGGEYFSVEVKGSPRPFGRVVARLESGEILWPAARALASRGRHARPSGKAAARMPSIDRPEGVRLVPIWQQMALELIVLVAAAGFAAIAAAVTVHHANEAEAVAARSQRVDAEVIDGRGTHVTVRFDWEGGPVTATAPAQSGSGYQEGLRYPALVDPQRPTSVRTAMEPYNAVGPIVSTCLVAAAAAILVAHRLVQRLFARRRIHDGPWYTMLAVVTQLTARFAVVQLHAPRDWPGSRRAIVFMPRTKPWTKMVTGREVTVCGTLNPLDSPVVIVDGRAHVPASRLFFGPPWRGSNAWRVPWSRRNPKARRSTRPGWSET